MSTESNAKIFSVIGGCRRSGRWLVPHETSMLTLFGRAVIDLREARTAAEELEFTCTSMFANVTFIVPEGAEVRPSGMAIFGSSKSVVPVSDVACELPPMSIEAITVFGRLRIRTTDEAPVEDESRRQRRRRRKADAKRRAVGEPTSAAGPAPPTAAPETSAPPVTPAPHPAPLFVAVDTSEFGRPEPETALDAPAMAPRSKDLSSPIEAFAPPAEPARSPLTDADAPESLAGTLLDDEPAPPLTDPAVDPAPAAAGGQTDEPAPESDGTAADAEAFAIEAPEANAATPGGGIGDATDDAVDADVGDEFAAAES